MANTTVNLIQRPIGPAGIDAHLPVAAATHLYEGSLVSQLAASGAVVPYSTALSGACIGVAAHEVDNTGSAGDKRVKVETKRIYAFANGTSGDACSEATLMWSVVYGVDDHTIADNSNTQARKPVGFFAGMEPDGRVRVFVDPPLAAIVAILQTLTDAPATADALRETIVAAFG